MIGPESWRDATSAGDGRHALLVSRLLHYDLSAAAVSVHAVADRLPAAARVRALQAALGGDLLLGAHQRHNGVLLQVSLYCKECAEGVLDAVLAQQTTDRTMVAWCQLRAQVPALPREHLMPAVPPMAPWIISEMRPRCCHADQVPWLLEACRPRRRVHRGDLLPHGVALVGHRLSAKARRGVPAMSPRSPPAAENTPPR